LAIQCVFLSMIHNPRINQVCTTVVQYQAVHTSVLKVVDIHNVLAGQPCGSSQGGKIQEMDILNSIKWKYSTII